MTSASDDSAARPIDPDLTVVVTGVSATGAAGATVQAAAGPSPTAPPAATAPVQQASSNVLPVGTQLAEFTVSGVIGEGGFGIVYRAHDRSLQRIVAVKEYMPSALASRLADTRVVVKSEQHRETFEIGLKSFINEARLLAQFDHPALVKVFRFWAANGTAYMAMPLYEGGTLKQALKAMATPPDEAWLRKLLVPLLDAIELLHAADCLHRDIAPDNVLMGPGSVAGTPRPVLLDFGAARRVIGGQTQALTVILKPGYAPIEQYDEIPGMKQGPWTDLYALGAVIHTAITGKPPPPSVGRLIHDAWVPLSQVAAGRYSPGFLAAIDAVLASRPDDRPRSVAQWRAMLAGSDGAAAMAPDAVSAWVAAPGDGPRTEQRTGGHSHAPAATSTATPTTLAATALAALQPTTSRSSGARPASGAPSTAVPAAVSQPTRWGRAVMFGAIAGVLIVGLLWSAIYWQGVKSEQQLARSGGSAKAASPPADGAPMAPVEPRDVASATPPATAPGTGAGLPPDVKPPAALPVQVEPTAPVLSAPAMPSPAPVVTAPSPNQPATQNKTPAKKTEPPRNRPEPPRSSPPPAAPVEVPVAVAAAPTWIDVALREGRACLAGKQYACTIARAESVLKAEPNHAGALALLKDGRSAQEQALGSDWKMR